WAYDPIKQPQKRTTKLIQSGSFRYVPHYPPSRTFHPVSTSPISPTECQNRPSPHFQPHTCTASTISISVACRKAPTAARMRLACPAALCCGSAPKGIWTAHKVSEDVLIFC